MWLDTDGVCLMGRDGRRVVVIDDDEAVRESLAFLLETAGYSVVSFASAPDYLVAMRPECTACLLVDQHMPGMTGLEFLTELQRQGVRVPALLLTGSPSPDLLRRAEALEVQQVLAKPLAEDALLRFVESVFH